jgi:hypothetical protein
MNNNSIYQIPGISFKTNCMERRIFIKNAGIASSMIAVSLLLVNCQTSGDESFPLMDLHVHLTDTFSISRRCDNRLL